MISAARAQSAAGPASGASTASGAIAEDGEAVQAGSGNAAAEGADYLALLIEHGGSYWPFFAALVFAVILHVRRDLNLSFDRDGFKAEVVQAVQRHVDQKVGGVAEKMGGVAQNVDVVDDDLGGVKRQLAAQARLIEELRARLSGAAASDGDAEADRAVPPGLAGMTFTRGMAHPGPPATGQPESGPPMPAPAASAGPTDGQLHDRLVAALNDPRYVWRSLDRLSLEAGASPEQVRHALAENRSEFTLGRGVSGREIARLASRDPKASA
ncbi:MAG: hypothetical protein AAF763_17180 [Pseudomonadota bacterium]